MVFDRRSEKGMPFAREDLLNKGIEEDLLSGPVKKKMSSIKKDLQKCFL